MRHPAGRYIVSRWMDAIIPPDHSSSLARSLTRLFARIRRVGSDRCLQRSSIVCDSESALAVSVEVSERQGPAPRTRAEMQSGQGARCVFETFAQSNGSGHEQDNGVVGWSRNAMLSGMTSWSICRIDGRRCPSGRFRQNNKV